MQPPMLSQLGLSHANARMSLGLRACSAKRQALPAYYFVMIDSGLAFAVADIGSLMVRVSSIV
jgi:hypothetical protein